MRSVCVVRQSIWPSGIADEWLNEWRETQKNKFPRMPTSQICGSNTPNIQSWKNSDKDALVIECVCHSLACLRARELALGIERGTATSWRWPKGEKGREKWGESELRGRRKQERKKEKREKREPSATA